MDVIAVESFIVHGQNDEEYVVGSFEHGELITTFVYYSCGFLRLKFHRSGNTVYHGKESLLGKQLLSHAQYHTTYRNDPPMMEKLFFPIHMRHGVDSEWMREKSRGKKEIWRKDFLSHEDMYI